MIVIPMGTDAPIYHRPYATVAMILLNVAAFFAINVALLSAVPPEADDPAVDDGVQVVDRLATPFDRFSLTLGDGLHPVQWTTHNFLHNDVFHLAGNMIFLWAFGIVVEGKLGALKYLAAYLAIGTLHGAFVQLLMLRSGLDGQSAGASAVVYGLLAACMIWAPRNELNCTIILPVGYRVLVFQREFYYTTVALFYLGGQVIGLLFWGGLAGQIMVSELGHLSGALWGSVIAVLLLKAGWVDCEGWDLFALWSQRRQLARDWKARGDRLDRQDASLRDSLRADLKARNQRGKDARDEPSPEVRAAAASRRVLGSVEKGEVDAALMAYDKASRDLPFWPSQVDLYAIIKALHARGAVVDSVRPMKDHCRRFPAASDKMRLKLAQVLIRDRQRPIAALAVLEEIPPGSLPPDLERTRTALARQAERMRDDGVLELEGDD